MKKYINRRRKCNPGALFSGQRVATPLFTATPATHTRIQSDLCLSVGPCDAARQSNWLLVLFAAREKAHPSVRRHRSRSTRQSLRKMR